MADGDQQYYRPYDSADESGSEDNESHDSWTSSGFNTESDQDLDRINELIPNGPPNFKAFATQIQLRDAAGPSFSTIRDQVSYGTDRLGKYTVFSQYDQGVPDISGEDQYGLTRFTTADSDEVSIIMINSRFRDRTAYAQPTYFSISLPRTYKTIKSMNFAEIKLLTSFYYFRDSKGNTDITLYEKDRTTYTYENTYQSTIIKSYIRQGSYNISQLVSELTTQLNYTPLFFDYINGFSDFYPLFQASGDYSLNFNQPGDTFYNRTTKMFEQNPTMNSITLHFWKTRTAGLYYYTIEQCKLVYYYPPLVEYIQDPDYATNNLNLSVGIGIDPTITTNDDVIERILYTFIGINPVDPVVLAVIEANIDLLDKYRVEHTFRFYLINNYIVDIESQSQNVFFTTNRINTSLYNLLNIQQNKFLQQALDVNGITLSQYNALAISVSQLLAILNDMYSFTQTNFLTYFAVPWVQYSLSYYATLENVFFIQNGINAVDIPSNYYESINAGIITYDTDIYISSLKINPQYYWPNLDATNASTISMINLSSVQSSTILNSVYDMNTYTIHPKKQVVDSNNYLYTDYLTNSMNVVCPIEAAKYTVFKFISPVRQTIQVETLPRPTQYRIPLYNESNYDSTIQKYFNYSYSFSTFTSNYPYTPNSLAYTYAYDNLPSKNLIQIPGWTLESSSSNSPKYSWNRNYQSSFQEQYTSSIQLDINSYKRASFFQFTTPEVKNGSSNSNYTYLLNVTAQFYTDIYVSSLVNPNAQCHMYLYHDRGGFQADILNVRNENDLFYKYSTIITTQSYSNTIQLRVYPHQTYYVILRPDTIHFGNLYSRVAPWFSSNYDLVPQSLSVANINPQTDIEKSYFSSIVQSNFQYAQVYDSNWIQLPIQSNFWPPDPDSNIGNKTLYSYMTPIGYDIDGVSTDYTDYIPYTPNSYTITFNPENTLAIDPITQYQFNKMSPYNSTLQTYLYPNAENYLFTPGLVETYTPGNVDTRQTKIVHYYSVNYIPESESVFPLVPGSISPYSNAQRPYTVSTTGNPIPGYKYGGGTQSTIQMSRGSLGFNFIPDEGVWDVKKVVFRSAIEDSEKDPNASIAYLGVYSMDTVLSKYTSLLSLSTAICVLSNSARVSYTSDVTETDNGTDAKGGTYYEFQKDTDFVPEVERPILGYSQLPNTMSDQPESMYTIVAFSKYGNPLPIKALSGSAIPYPFYNTISTSKMYIDGTKAYNSTFGVIYPSLIGQTDWPFATYISSVFAPSPGISQSQSQYALSIPIGTSVLSYKNALSIYNNSSWLNKWNTTINPSFVVGTVPNYILLQDTNIKIYPYDPLQTNRSFDLPDWTLTAEQIYPLYEYTSLVAIAGNSTYYYFLGFSNDRDIYNSIRLKRYNPVTGILYEYLLDEDNTLSFSIPIGGGVKSFTVNDNEQMIFTYQNSTYDSVFYYTTPKFTTLQMTPIPSNATATHAMDPQTSTCYWMPLDPTTGTGTNFYKWSLNTVFPGNQYTISGGPALWTSLTVNAASNVPCAYDRVFFNSQTAGYSSNVYISSNWNTNSLEVKQVSTSMVFNSSNPKYTITNGYKGSIWCITNGNQQIWGTRNTEPDIEGVVESAWQIFYPFQKIILEKVAATYTPITDTTYINYPEYPHTQCFYYSNTSTFLNDTTNKWGLENSSNFTVADTQKNGYYFNSYIFNVPVHKSLSSNDYQYITVRGMTPTESSETLLRMNVTNKYTFGYVTQKELFVEISTLKSGSESNLFNLKYAYTLSNFDISYRQSNSFFGQDVIPNFIGSSIDSSNYQEFETKLSSIYGDYAQKQKMLNNIANYVDERMYRYISTNLRYIFPNPSVKRQNYTAPFTFKILWRTSLLPQYVPLLEDWGLGYNLGFNKVDTPTYSTYTRASSFYKILDDYIYLRLNPEFKMNRLDSTNKENLTITRDSTGQTDQYYGKLLLNNFNSYSTTFINNQSIFNPPIGRLEKMYFQWVDVGGVQLNDTQCEWTASLTITEAKTKATLGSTLPALPSMKPIRK